MRLCFRVYSWQVGKGFDKADFYGVISIYLKFNQKCCTSLIVYKELIGKNIRREVWLRNRFLTGF